MLNSERVKNLARQNKKSINTIIKYCEKNNIGYVLFENVNELFQYYDEEKYTVFTNEIITLIFANGWLLKILD